MDPQDDARRAEHPDRQAERHDSASRFADSVGRGVDGFLTGAAGGTDLTRPFPDRDPLAPRSGWAIAAPLLVVLAAGGGFLGWRAVS